MDNIKLKDILDWFEGVAYLEVCGEEWKIKDDYVYYGMPEEGDEDDWVYSAELLRGSFRKDGFFVVNVDNGCGETVTMIFEESKEVE